MQNIQRTERKTTANNTFAIGRVSCSADSFVVAESAVLRTNICGKIPPIANLQPAIGNFPKKTVEK